METKNNPVHVLDAFKASKALSLSPCLKHLQSIAANIHGHLCLKWGLEYQESNQCVKWEGEMVQVCVWTGPSQGHHTVNNNNNDLYLVCIYTLSDIDVSSNLGVIQRSVIQKKKTNKQNGRRKVVFQDVNQIDFEYIPSANVVIKCCVYNKTIFLFNLGEQCQNIFGNYSPWF